MKFVHCLVASVLVLVGSHAFALENVIGSSLSRISITEITDIRVISQTIDPAMVLNSEMVVEVTGIYEGAHEPDKVVALLDRTDDHNPMNYYVFEPKFYGVNDEPNGLAVGSKFVTAISSPHPFKVTFLVKTSGWGSDDKFAEWSVIFPITKYQPVYHVVNRSFRAVLQYTDGIKRWTFDKWGFEQI